MLPATMTAISIVRAGGPECLVPESRPVPQPQAGEVLIEGHADERGTREYNLAIGDRRANAV